MSRFKDSRLNDREAEQRWMSRVRCPRGHLLVFIRQFSIMLGAGVPIVRAMETLSEQPDYPRFGDAVTTMADKTAEGYTLSRVFSFFPRLFSPVHCAMCDMGERTGTLADSMARVADWGDHDLRLYRDVKGALTYPVVVLCVAFLLTMLLFLTVVPGFVTMFEEQNMELPWITQIIVRITNIISNPGAWVVGITVAVLSFLEFRRFGKTDKGALMIFRTLLLLPGIGRLLLTATTSRYAGALGTLLESGLDLLTSLKLAAQASGSPSLRADSERMAEEIQEGQSLAQAFALRPDIYPALLSEMAKVGEETSSVAPSLRETAAFLNLEVSSLIETLSAALEPILLAMVSTLVGTILLAIILPLYGFLNQLGI